MGRLAGWGVCLWVWLALSVSAAPQFPELSGRVVDGAHLLSSSERQSLIRQLEQHERQTGNQLVVVTLPGLEGQSIEEYGYQLGRHWGIGQAKHNNGVLLLVAPAERKVRIEVGYGLEGALPDAIAANIIQTRILPAFRRGDMGGGIRAGVTAILAAIQGEYQAKPVVDKGHDRYLPFLFFVLMLLVILLRHAGPRGFRRSHTGRYGGWGGGGRSRGSGGFRGGGGGFGGGGASGGW